MVESIVFAMHFANPKYWGTWQLRISYRLEKNDMTGDGVNDTKNPTPLSKKSRAE
jgi:hypothetical protein